MLGGSHIIFANGLVSNLTSHPISGFVLGLITHHLADICPHIDLNILNKKIKGEEFNFYQLPLKIQLIVLLELLIGIVFSLYFFVYLFQKNLILISFISLGSITPDLLTMFFGKQISKYNLGKKYINLHKKYHFKLKTFNRNYIIFILLIQIFLLFVSLVFFKSSLKFV
jgi:hypothetical protein